MCLGQNSATRQRGARAGGEGGVRANHTPIQQRQNVIDSPTEQLSRHKCRLKDERNFAGTQTKDYARTVF